MRRPILSVVLALSALCAFPADEPRSRGFDEPVPIQTGFAAVNGIELFFRVYGEGPPILMIHGGLSDSRVWRAQLATLSEHHSVIVADSRGQGRSSSTQAVITYDLMADDYLALLDALHIPKVALVGWSDGGIIGLDIAIHHPERLSRLFVQAANATPDGAISYKPDDPNRPALRHYDDVRLEIQALWANEPNFSQAELEAIPVPTEIAIGEHDEAISREHTEYLASAIPGAKLLILPDVGHSAPLEDPDGYAAAVLDFVDGTTT
ncbi:alpha/beta fold hydrolase [Aureimonas flava]|uniref:Alpha/beta fold hydrolase n=1 Tax=Aureimonas flava TaxID=2320271 RepID=A0A3A1WPJ2_9HYPH|nr:alpha/beta fold hydrolase [Aureimonas flava]RIY03817.1 alpha/beta fold hydrolase [Aureimonas flava]